MYLSASAFIEPSLHQLDFFSESFYGDCNYYYIRVFVYYYYCYSFSPKISIIIITITITLFPVIYYNVLLLHITITPSLTRMELNIVSQLENLHSKTI